MVRLVCVSDTHGQVPALPVPDGDVLVHAGDLTKQGSLAEISAAHAWLASLPHAHKVVIAGNHDFGFEQEGGVARSLLSAVTYLQDEGAEILGLRFWGSPWQPRFFDWAFNRDRGEPLRRIWDRIPADTDVLITHGPPRGHGDRTARGEDVGCADLLDALRRVRPQVHVFGHIHEGHGITHEGPTTCVNASICSLGYEPTQAPLVVDVMPRS